MLYEDQAQKELKGWQKKMMRNPSLLDKLSRRMQVKMNSYIPEKVHKAITVTIKQMVRGVLFGATYTTKEQPASHSLLDIEEIVLRRVQFYKNAAAAEGAATGA